MKRSLLNFEYSPMINFFKNPKRAIKIIFSIIFLAGLPCLLGYAESWFFSILLIIALFVFFGFLLYSGAKNKIGFIAFFLLLFYYSYLAQVTFSILDRGAGETDTTAIAVIIFFIPYFVITLALAIITKYIVKKKGF